MITAQEFLRYFGSPLVLALPDIKGVNSFKDFYLHHNTAVLSAVNADPTTPYGLFFTPNGNYGAIQTEGKKISRSKIAPGPGPYYHALIVDIDIKEVADKYADLDALKLHIDDILSRITVHPTIINQSGGGFHLYRMIKEEDKQNVHEMFGDRIFAISRHMASLFDGGDQNATVTRGDINGIIRLTDSNHWKTGKPMPVKTIYHNPADVLDLDLIDVTLKAIGEIKKTETIKKDAVIVVGAKKYTETSSLKIRDVILKLEAYPRLYKGVHQTFKVEGGTHICIIDDAGNVDRTDSYRIRPEKNCVHCFLRDKYSLEERPGGEPRSFVHHYFLKNNHQVKAFFTKEFGIEFAAKKQDDVEQTIQTFTGNDYFVECTDKRVVMHKHVQRGKSTIELHDDMFKKPIKIIGKARTKFHANGTECEDEQMVYVMEVEINNDKVNKLLYRLPTKKRFNEKYSGFLFYYGEDNDLGMWYEAMDNSDIPTVQVTVLSGLYKNDDGTSVVILGGKVIYGEAGPRYFTPAFVCKTKLSKEIPLVDFYKKFNEIYEAEVAIPLFLQFIALCGMNTWEGTTIYPSLLVTGKTGCGKSSVAEILKNMAGYAATDRKIALPQITVQPYKIMCTDNAILFPDELTMSVRENVEEQSRNGINRDKGGRGMGSENAYYNFRCPFFFTGERTFKDESLNNRLMVIVLSEKYWKKDSKDKVIDIKNYSCIKEIYDGYINYQRDINETQADKVSMLVKSGISPRNADVRAYMFTINEVFQFGFEEEELLKITHTHLAKMGFGEDDAMTDEGELQMYLSKMLFTKQAQCAEERYSDMYVYRFMFMDDTAYQKARGQLTGIVNAINAHGNRITVSKHGIVIHIKDTNALAVDFVLEKVMAFVLTCNRYSIQYVDRNNEAGPALEH